MQSQCPICDSIEVKRYGKTPYGSQKYCCEICKYIFSSGLKETLPVPQINFLRFKKKHLFKNNFIYLQREFIRFKHLISREIDGFKLASKTINKTGNNWVDKILIFKLVFSRIINLIFTILFFIISSYTKKIFILFRNYKNLQNQSFKYLSHLLYILFTKIRCQKYYRWQISGFLVTLLIYTFMCIAIKINVNEPQPYDSYTLQALAWRSGNLNLPQDYNWLEIAMYQGKYYLSFPPVPTIPMLFLSFFFGEKTPSTWLMIVCFLSSYWITYKILRRFKNSDFHSAVWAVFLICGSSYLDISLFGWVWYMAQSMSFVLTLACILCLTYTSRTIQGIGLFCFALTVGCRPLQALYTPLILAFIYKKNQSQTILQTIRVIMPMLIAPILVAIALGTLNYLRFNSVLEFGHNYLPVLLAEPQFSLSYIPRNFIRLTTVFPSINSSGKLELPMFGGFAFYIANPIFIILGLRLINRWSKSKIDWVLLGIVLLHFFILMMHITFGAWQFGTRFLVDLLPAVLVLCTRSKQPIKIYEMAIMIFGLAFNIYGGIIFRTG